MPLFISDDDVVELRVFHTEKNGELTFYDEQEPMPEGAEKNRFVFRRPNWADQKTILQGTFTYDSNGVPLLDPHLFMDSKFRTLIKEWSLKDSKGDPLKIEGENIDRLHPDLMEHISDRIDEVLGIGKKKDIENPAKEQEAEGTGADRTCITDIHD